jgi:ATP-dependent helicase YprA (DUF1998 family)
MSVATALERLRLDTSFMANVSAWERLPSRPARHAPFPEGLDPALVQAAERLGTAPLYTHQAAAIEAAFAGENPVVVTTTASGKSLAYNLPVLQRWRRTRRPRYQTCCRRPAAPSQSSSVRMMATHRRLSAARCVSRRDC